VRERHEYSDLESMRPAATVASFQGQEEDIIVLVMGTKFPKPGPGFTANSQQLCVMLSRQKSGLIVVGDINIDGDEGNDQGKGKGGKGKGGKGKGKGKGKDKPVDKLRVVDANGEEHWAKIAHLRQVYAWFREHGRVALIDCQPDQGVAGPSTPAT